MRRRSVEHVDRVLFDVALDLTDAPQRHRSADVLENVDHLGLGQEPQTAEAETAEVILRVPHHQALEVLHYALVLLHQCIKLVPRTQDFGIGEVIFVEDAEEQVADERTYFVYLLHARLQVQADDRRRFVRFWRTQLLVSVHSFRFDQLSERIGRLAPFLLLVEVELPVGGSRLLLLPIKRIFALVRSIFTELLTFEPGH